MQEICARTSRGCSPERIGLLYRNGCGGCPQEDSLQEMKEIANEQDYAQRLRLQRQKIEVLKFQFEKKEQELVQRDALVARLTRERDTLLLSKQALEVLTLEHAKLRYQFERLSQNHLELRAKLQETNNLHLEQTVNELKQSLSSLKNQYQIQLVTTSRLQKTVATLRLQLSDQEENMAFQAKSFKIKLESVQSQLSGALAENKELRARLEAEGDDSGLKEVRLRDLSLALAQAEEDKEALRRLNEHKEQLVDCLKEKLSQLQLALHKQAAISASQLQQKEAFLRKKETQNKDLRLKVEELQAKLRLSSGDVEQLREQNGRLSRENKRLRVELEHFKSSASSGESAVGELRKELAQKEEQLSRLKCCKEQQRLVRQDLSALRLDARLVKRDEIDRIDELISQIGSKYVKRKG